MPFLKKVVVVEDEDAIAHLIEATLGDAGYLCLRARDGEEALRLVGREEPDLLVLDVLMPKMDGLEVVKRLKADPVLSRVPVLMLTALGSVDDRVRGLGAGADDYLSKPFDVRELLARAHALVRHNRRERDRSPTTGLPGPATLDAALATWLSGGAPFALAFAELAGFDAFVGEHGWVRGGEVVADVAKGLHAATEDTPGALLTHLGADGFAVLASAEAAPSLVEELKRQAAPRLASLAPPVTFEVTLIDVTHAKTTEDVARALAKARLRRQRPR